MSPFVVSGLLIFLTSSLLAALICKTAQDRRVNRLWFYLNLAVAAWGFGATVAALSKTPEAAMFWWRLSFSAGLLLGAIYFHISCALCETEDSRRPVILAVYVMHAVLVMLLLTGISIKDVRFVFNSFYVNEPTIVFTIATVVWVTTLALAHYDLIKHMSRLDKSERIPIKLFVIGTVVGFVGGSSIYLPIYRVDIYPYGNFLIPIYSAVAAYAVFRHHLMDIRIVISKGLVYSLLIAAITGIYLVMVLILERWFQGFIGYQSVIATLLVAFLIAIGFNPLRGVMQTFVDRMLFQGTPVELVAQRERLLTQVTQGEQMKAVATLAAGLAHEIKNPLAAMKTFVEYLPEKHQDPEFIERFSRVVGQEVSKMNDLVHRLLEFAKPSTPVLRAVDPYILVKETLDFLQESLVRKQIEVTMSGEAGSTLQADPVQLRQVLLNVLLNSIEAMEGPGNIWISVSDAKGKRVISIKDDGPGISKENLAHIFDPFFTTKATGTGLGLAVAQSIIRQHEGEIKVLSAVGKGTNFEVSLPYKPGVSSSE